MEYDSSQKSLDLFGNNATDSGQGGINTSVAQAALDEATHAISELVRRVRACVRGGRPRAGGRSYVRCLPAAPGSVVSLPKREKCSFCRNEQKCLFFAVNDNEKKGKGEGEGEGERTSETLVLWLWYPTRMFFCLFVFFSRIACVLRCYLVALSSLCACPLVRRRKCRNMAEA